MSRRQPRHGAHSGYSQEVGDEDRTQYLQNRQPFTYPRHDECHYRQEQLPYQNEIISQGVTQLLAGLKPMPGMPRARRNQRFSPEEDQHIIFLKEVHNLEWKKIANFFPGRTYGTIHCHYCTKLKKREWTVEAVCMYNLWDEMAHDTVLFGTTNFKWSYSNTSGKNGPI